MKRNSIVNFTTSNNVVSVPVNKAIITQQPVVFKTQVVQPPVQHQPLNQSQAKSTVRPPIQQIVRQFPSVPLQQNVVFSSQKVLLPPQGVQRFIVSQAPFVLPQAQVQVQPPVLKVERQVIQQQLEQTA